MLECSNAEDNSEDDHNRGEFEMGRTNDSFDFEPPARKRRATEHQLRFMVDVEDYFCLSTTTFRW